MRSLLLLLGALAACSLASAKDVQVNVDGKDVAVAYREVGRDITAQDRGSGSQDSAVACSLLYYGLLAKGDVAGAAKLATDPAAAEATWTQYKKRVGAADFAKEMAAYFTVKNRIVAELGYGDETMLLVKTPDYTAGQIYRQKDGKYFVVTGRPFSQASKVLGKALNLYNDGALKP